MVSPLACESRRGFGKKVKYTQYKKFVLEQTIGLE